MLFYESPRSLLLGLFRTALVAIIAVLILRGDGLPTISWLIVLSVILLLSYLLFPKIYVR